MKRVSVFLIALFYTITSFSQTIENVIHELPPHFSILTTWGSVLNGTKPGRTFIF
jgi:hypothetical protein